MDVSHHTALFGLGCFWEPEYYFGHLPGVLQTEVGYSGGTSRHPTYHNLGDHTETLQLAFDPHRIHYEELLGHFWQQHDPTIHFPQQYRSVIFYTDENQRLLAEKSKQQAQQQYKEPIITSIEPAGRFYPAEAYHQHYVAKMNGEE